MLDMRNLTGATLLAVLLASGCCAEEEGLTVRGSVVVTLDEAETGFFFNDDTRLVAPDSAEAGDLVSGRCTIDASGQGLGSVEVDLVRPGEVEPGSRAIRAFEATFVDAVGQVEGEVSADLGGTRFEAAGGAGCELHLIYVNTETAQAGLEASCQLQSADGEGATLEASLHFRDCELAESGEADL